MTAPNWSPTISLGNVLTILMIAFGATAAWVQFEHRMTAVEEHQVAAASQLTAAINSFDAALADSRDDRKELRQKVLDLEMWRNRFGAPR